MWMALNYKSNWLHKHLPDFVSSHLEVKFAECIKINHLNNLSLAQRQVLYIDILYACLKHYDWIQLSIFRQSLISLLQSQHGLANQQGNHLVKSMSDELMKYGALQPYWCSEEHADLFILYMLTLVISNDEIDYTSEIGLSPDLLHLIHKSLSDAAQYPAIKYESPTIAEKVQQIIANFLQKMLKIPWLVDAYNLQFSVEPNLSPRFRIFTGEHGYDWLLAALSIIGEKGKIKVIDMQNILRDCLSLKEEQEFLESDMQSLLDSLIRCDLIYIIGNDLKKQVALHKRGYARTAIYFSHHLPDGVLDPDFFYRLDSVWQQVIIKKLTQNDPQKILQLLENSRPLHPSTISLCVNTISGKIDEQRLLEALKAAYFRGPTPEIRSSICKSLESYVSREDVRLFFEQVLRSERSGQICHMVAEILAKNNKNECQTITGNDTLLSRRVEKFLWKIH